MCIRDRNSNVQNQKAETLSYQCFAYFNLVMLLIYFSFTLVVIIVDLIRFLPVNKQKSVEMKRANIDLTLPNSALKPYFL